MIQVLPAQSMEGINKASGLIQTEVINKSNIKAQTMNLDSAILRLRVQLRVI